MAVTGHLLSMAAINVCGVKVHEGCDDDIRPSGSMLSMKDFHEEHLQSCVRVDDPDLGVLTLCVKRRSPAAR
jgi:hypothetical protein